MKAVLVIEMQRDFLWEKRKAKFTYDTGKLVTAVNELIDREAAAGSDILYISQVFPDEPTNHIVFGFCIAGTEGTALYDGLHVVSEYRFEKNVADVFLSQEFADFFREKGYNEVTVCGIDEAGSVAAAAKGAKKAGAAVTVVKSCTATRFPLAKIGLVRAELKAEGIQYL